MDDKYLNELYEWTSSQDGTFKGRYDIDTWKSKLNNDEDYRKKFYSWVSSIDSSFESRRPYDTWEGLVKKKQSSQPTSQETDSESTIVEETTPISSDISEEKPKGSFGISTTKLEGIHRQFGQEFEDVDINADQQLLAAIDSGAITQEDLIAAGLKEGGPISTLTKYDPNIEAQAKAKIMALQQKTPEDIQYAIESKKLDAPFLYEGNVEGESMIDDIYQNDLKGLNINTKDFEGFLKSKGHLDDFYSRVDKGLFDRSFGSGNDPQLSYELEKLRMLNLYIDHQTSRDIEYQKLLDQKEYGVHPDFVGKAHSFSLSKGNVHVNKLSSYIESEMPMVTNMLIERDNKNKELYDKYNNGEVGVGTLIANNVGEGWKGFSDRIDQVSASFYGAIPFVDYFENVSESIQLKMDQDDFFREDNLSYGYVSGKEVELDGKEYMVDNNNQVYDLSNKLRVTEFLDQKTYNTILTKSTENARDGYSFSARGASYQTANVVGDMAVQIGMTGATGKVLSGGAGLATGLKYGDKIGGAIKMNKMLKKNTPISRDMSSAMIAQGTLGGISGYQGTFMEARAAGLNDAEARELAHDASIQMAALFVLTTPLSPQTKATKALFGDLKKKTTKEAVEAYIGSGKRGFVEVFKKRAQQITELTEEGIKEMFQENVQQTSEILGVNKGINEAAGKKILNDEISLDDFINTSIISFTSGMLMPGAGSATNSANKKMRSVMGMDGVDRLKSLELLIRKENKLKGLLKSQVEKGVYTQQQVDNLMSEINTYKDVAGKMPKNIKSETALEIIDDLKEITKEETRKKQLDPAFHEEINENIEAIRDRIKRRASIPPEVKPTQAKPFTTEEKPTQAKPFTTEEKPTTVGELLNRPVTLTELGGSKLETPVEGDMYVEGQQVVVEDANGNIIEVGNVDEISGKTLSEMGISQMQGEIKTDNEGNLRFNDDTLVPDKKGIKTDKRGNVSRVVLRTPDGSKTVTLRGVNAEEAAYQILLKEAQSPEQIDKINKLLEQDEEFQNELREAATAAETETDTDTQQATPEQRQKIEKPTQEQILKDVQEGNVYTFTYKKEESIPDVLKDKVSSVNNTTGERKVTISKSEADFLLQETGETIVEKTEPVSVDNAPKGHYVNVGMKSGKTDKEIKEGDIVASLPSDVKVLGSTVKLVESEGGTEKTLSLELSRSLTDLEMSKFLNDTEQMAIPQLSNGKGVMFGTLDWGPFNPIHFVMPDGRQLSDIVQTGVDKLAEIFSQKQVGDKTMNSEDRKLSIKKQADRAIKSIAKLFPRIKINVYFNESEYHQAIGIEDFSAGTYLNNVISINLSRASATTVPHEVFHAILSNTLKSEKQIQELTKRFVQSLERTQDPRLIQVFKEAVGGVEQYQDVANEEIMSELFGVLSGEYKRLNPKTQNLIKRFLDQVAKLLGLKQFTDAEVVDVLNVLAGKVATGEAIESTDISPLNKGEKETETEFKTRKQISSLNSNISNVLKFAQDSSLPTNIEFKQALQERFKEDVPLLKKEYGIKSASVMDNSLKKYLIDAYVNETLIAIDSYPNAIGWYDSKTKAAMFIMSLIHPELNTDPDAATLFKIATAITSNGNKVFDNFKEANRQYEHYKAKGSFDGINAIGTQGAGIKASFKLVNNILNRMSVSEFNDFLTTKFKAGDLKYTAINGKTKNLLSGFTADTEVYGASIFGAKIGNGFFMNLNGQFDQLTMDRWFMRQYGRLTGTLIKNNKSLISENKKRLSDAKKALSLEDKRALNKLIPGYVKLNIIDLANKIHTASAKVDKRKILQQNPQLNELRKAGNILSKNNKGEVEAPQGGVQRSFIIDVFNGVQKILKETYDLDMTIADLQAVNWYPEKALYQTFQEGKNIDDGSTETSDNEQPDYENAAEKLAKQKGITTKQIQDAKRTRKDGESNRESNRSRARELNGNNNRTVKKLTKEILTLKSEGVEQPVVKKQYTPISPDTSSKYASMTEDGNNFVFFHVGSPGYKVIKRGTGNSIITSREESAALQKVGGLAMYYTDPNASERTSATGAKYVVMVPKDKVYDFNTDDLNFFDQAQEMHSKEHPGMAFDKNSSLAYITKVAGQNGFDMVVSEWAGMLRAQTTKEMAPLNTDKKYIGNKEKGWVPVEPELKKDKLKKVYNDISKERNNKKNYDSLYHLYHLAHKYTQNEITEMVQNSDLPNSLKESYQEAADYVQPSGRSENSKKQVSGRPSIAQVRFQAKKNGISEADADKFLKQLGYSDSEIESSKNQPLITAEELVERSERAIKEKLKGRTLTESIRYLRKKIFDRQTYIKDVLKGIGNRDAHKAHTRLVTKAGAKGWANYRYKKAEKEIYSNLSDQELKQLNALIYARRIVAINENRINRGMEQYVGPMKYGYNEAKADVDKLSNDKLSKRADLYFKVYNENLKRLKDSGRISDEIYDELKNIEYSPIKTIKYIIGDNHSANEINQLASSIGMHQKDIMRLSDENVNDAIMDSKWLLMMNISAIENRAATNEVLNLFYDALNSATNEDLEGIKDLILPNPIIDTKKSGAPKFKYDAVSVPLGYKTVSFFKNGAEYKMVMKEEYARQLIDARPTDKALKSIRTWTFGNVLRFFATSGNPLFVFGNTAIDFQNILFLSDIYSSFKLVGGIELGYDFVKNSIKKMVRTKSYNKMFEEFMKHGGGLDFLSVDGLRAVNSLRMFNKPRTIAQKALVQWGNFWSYAGETSELAFRLAVYEKTRSNLINEYKKKNKNEPTGQALEDILYESARESRETIDFNQGGDWIKSADYIAPYLNASVQGARRAVDYASKNPVGFTSSMVQYGLMSAGLFASSIFMLMSAFSDDDDDEKAEKIKKAWDSVSEHEKAAYHIIFTGRQNEEGEYEYKRFKKLPVIGILSTIVEEAIMHQLLKSNKIDYEFNTESTSKALDLSLPIGLSDIKSRNPVVAGALSYYYNKDTFTGQEIFRAPRDKKILPEHEGIYDNKVEQIYKDMAPIFKMSPKRSQIMVEKVITNERTNPLVGIMYGGYNGLFSKETTIGEEMVNTGKRVIESVDKKMTRYTNKDLKAYKLMRDEEHQSTVIESEIYKKEQKVYNEIKKMRENGDDITTGFLKDIIMENFDKIDWKKYAGKFSTYSRNADISRSLLDLIYEDTPEVQAYMLFNRYGDSLDSEEKKELTELMKAAKRKLSPKALYIYKNKYTNIKGDQ